MFIKEYKNDLLYHYACKKCGRTWNDDGEEITDIYLSNKIYESETTLIVICPMCEKK